MEVVGRVVLVVTSIALSGIMILLITDIRKRNAKRQHETLYQVGDLKLIRKDLGRDDSIYCRFFIADNLWQIVKRAEETHPRQVALARLRFYLPDQNRYLDPKDRYDRELFETIGLNPDEIPVQVGKRKIL